MRSAFRGLTRKDLTWMIASQRSKEAQPDLSQIFPLPRPLPAVKKLSDKENLRSRNPRYSPPHPKIVGAVWANGWGDFVNVDSTSTANGYNFVTGGITLGVDYRIGDHFSVGLFGSYAYTTANLQPTGDIDVNTGTGGLYATYFDRGFYVNGAVSGGYNSYNTRRQGLNGSANGSTNGAEFSTFAQAGYNFHVGNFTVGA